MELDSLSLFEDLAVSSCCISQGKSFTPPSWVVPMKESLGVAIHVIKEGEVIETLKLDDSRKYTLFGRCPIASQGNEAITLHHLSISRTHAAIVSSGDETLYIIDLGSSHGTFLNGSRIKPFLATPLYNRTTIRFGQSTRDYLMRIVPKQRGFDDECEEVDKEASFNTLLNCMVGYCKPEQECVKPERTASTKLERRVSFSCLAPEIILFQDCPPSSTTPMGDTCMYASPPEIKFRKSPKAERKVAEEEFELEPNKRFRELVVMVQQQ